MRISEEVKVTTYTLQVSKEDLLTIMGALLYKVTDLTKVEEGRSLHENSPANVLVCEIQKFLTTNK